MCWGTEEKSMTRSSSHVFAEPDVYSLTMSRVCEVSWYVTCEVLNPWWVNYGGLPAPSKSQPFSEFSNTCELKKWYEEKLTSKQLDHGDWGSQHSFHILRFTLAMHFTNLLHQSLHQPLHQSLHQPLHQSLPFLYSNVSRVWSCLRRILFV